MRSTQTFSGLLLAALLAAPLGVRAEEEPSWRADAGYASRYISRGLEQAGASTQASLGLARGSLRGGLWANLPTGGGEKREVDLSASYLWPTEQGYSLELSARNYWVGGAAAAGVQHSFEAGIVALAPALSGYTPSLAYYRDVRLRADTMQVSLAHSIALTQLGAFLDLNFFAGWRTGTDWRPDAPGPRRQDSYGYWGVEAHLPYRFPGSPVTLTGGLHYANATGHSSVNGPFSLSEGQNLGITLGVSLDF